MKLTDEAFDELVAQLDPDPGIEIFGERGLLKQLTERLLAADVEIEIPRDRNRASASSKVPSRQT